MSYIKKRERIKYAFQLSRIADVFSRLSNEKKVGELNYLITSIVKIALGPSPRYSEYNLVIGALESARATTTKSIVMVGTRGTGGLLENNER